MKKVAIVFCLMFLLACFSAEVQYQQPSDFGVTKSSMFKGIHKEVSPRLTSVLQKALRGESPRIAVIGGSNSAGGGIENKDDIFYRMFVSWLSHVIKPKTGSLMQLSVLALGGTGSDFFSLCLQNYIYRGAIAFPEISIVERSAK